MEAIMEKKTGEQRSFEFMHTMPTQRKPSAEQEDYLAYLKSIREPSTPRASSTSVAKGE
jgi:hypothetical protein